MAAAAVTDSIEWVPLCSGDNDRVELGQMKQRPHDAKPSSGGGEVAVRSEERLVFSSGELGRARRGVLGEKRTVPRFPADFHEGVERPGRVAQRNVYGVKHGVAGGPGKPELDARSGITQLLTQGVGMGARSKDLE